MSDAEQLKATAKKLIESDDPVKAIEVLAQLKVLKDPWGMYVLAGCYTRGTGVAQDQKLANQLLLEAAELGFADAQALYGNNLAYGIGTEKDITAGLPYLYKAADQANPLALYVLGELSLKGDQEFASDPAKTIEYFTKASELGYHPAMQRLGFMYEYGIGTDKDLDRALFLNTTAADLGNRFAAYNVSGSYKQGIGTPVNHEKHIHYLKIAAEQGLVYAIHNLAAAYCKGIEVQQDLVAGRELYEKAAYMGNGLSAYNLSSMYERGEGGEKDMALAAVWASTALAQYCHQAKGSFDRLINEMSAEDIERTVECLKGGAGKGLHWAQVSLAALYKRGFLVEQSDAQAAHWQAEAEKTKDQQDLIREQFQSSGFAEGMLAEVAEYEKNENYGQAYDVLLEAACLGSPKAQCKLGEYYQPGGIIGNDNKRSLYWFSQSAEQDYAPAELWLAIKFQAGDGVDKDTETANYYYTRAAFHGDDVAQGYIGHLYVTGNGVEQDYETAAQWFALSAQQGNVSAIYDLGSMYKNGYFFEKDLEKANAHFEMAANGGLAIAQFEQGVKHLNSEAPGGIDRGIHWLELACAQNYPPALNYLGQLLARGGPVPVNPQRSFDLFCRAAEQNDPEGYVSLGVSYSMGIGCPVDGAKSIENYKLAADMGHSQGRFNLAWCYQFGRNVEQNLDLARELFEKSAAQGNPGGLRGLAQMYESGLGGAQQSIEKAVELYTLAADIGDVVAQYELGCRYVDGNGVDKDLRKAEKYLTMAAMQGDISAQLNLGTLYFQGVDGTPDYANALTWYQNAHDNGHPKAGSMLGYIYLEGLGVESDPVLAVKCYEQGAELGEVYAQYNLAMLLRGEKGVPSNPEKVLFWLKEAAGNNFPPAQIDYALELMKGEGVNQNLVEAYKWILVAEALGEDRSSTVKEYCEKHAESRDLEEGEKLASAYIEALNESQRV